MLSRSLTAAALIACAAPLWAQDIARTELTRADVPGVPGMKVIVSRLEIPAGATAIFPKDAPLGGLTNMGDAPMIAITTQVIEKGKPYSSLVN